MEPSTLLTLLTILVALLTALVYALQIAELAEKRIVQLIGWLKRRKSKQTQNRLVGVPQQTPQQGEPLNQQDPLL
jgi:hypothetical protein